MTKDWMHYALMEFDETEIAGDADNPKIITYHAHTDLKAVDDETAWCSAFANFCMDGANIQGTRKANARSWLTWGRDVEPQYGAVTVLFRGDPNGWTGHVGFLVRFDKDWVWLLGGNQGNRVSIAKFPRERVLGFRLPN